MIPKNATPAERILASLEEESSEAENYSASAIEVLPITEIERLPLEHVMLKLNNVGLDYFAGLERVRELVGAATGFDKENPAYHRASASLRRR